MEFKAVKVGDDFEVKAVVEKKGSDVIIHVPSFKLMDQMRREAGGKIKQYGVRHIQSIQG